MKIIRKTKSKNKIDRKNKKIKFNNKKLILLILYCIQPS